MSDFSKLTTQSDLSEAAMAALAEDGYTNKAVLLSLTGEDIDNFEGQKEGTGQPFKQP